jgi:hypothetical protein
MAAVADQGDRSMANGGAGAIVVTRNSDDPDIGDLLAKASGLDLDAQPIRWKRA